MELLMNILLDNKIQMTLVTVTSVLALIMSLLSTLINRECYKGINLKKVATSIGISLILMVIGIVVLIIFYKTVYLFFTDSKIENTDRLNVLSSFCSTILGFIGTYIIFILTNKRENEKEKKAEDLKLKNKIKYDKDMLYTLLKFTISETNAVVELIIMELIDINCNIEKIKIEQMLPKIESDYNWIQKSLNVLKNPKYSNPLRNKIDTVFINNLIYDNNWTNYLEHENIDIRAKIIIWINTLKSKELDICAFIQNRDVIVEYLRTVDKYSPLYNDTKNESDLYDGSILGELDYMKELVKQKTYEILGMTNVLKINTSREILKLYIEKL